jgi:hypothetical protein
MLKNEKCESSQHWNENKLECDANEEEQAKWKHPFYHSYSQRGVPTADFTTRSPHC